MATGDQSQEANMADVLAAIKDMREEMTGLKRELI